MNSELFIDVFKHIKKHTRCNKDDPILLLLDNHTCHTTLQTIIFSRDNAIVLLSFPPHCSHHLQPLDIAIFGPKLENYFDIPKMASLAYRKAFTESNIKSAFEKPGVWPLNRLIFSDADFEAAYVTDRELIIDPGESAESLELKPNAHIEVPSTSNSTPLTPEQLRPFQKAVPRKNKSKRERGKSRIYTDSPEKNRLEEMVARKGMSLYHKENIKTVKKNNKTIIQQKCKASDSYSPKRIRSADKVCPVHKSLGSESDL